MSSAKPSTPPTTPPAIAPASGPEEPDEPVDSLRIVLVDDRIMLDELDPAAEEVGTAVMEVTIVACAVPCPGLSSDKHAADPDVTRVRLVAPPVP